MLSPEAAAAAARKYWGWGLLAVAVALAPTVTYLAMNFVEMVWALALAALSMLLVWMLSPAVLDWAGNKRLQMVKAEAAANPIETMDNSIIQTRNDLGTQRESVISVDTQWENVKKILASLRKTDPDEAASMGESEHLLAEASAELHSKYDAACDALEVFIKTRDKMSRLWSASIAINKALAIAGAARDNEVNRIKNQVAFEAVDANMSKAMAGLRMAVSKHAKAESNIIEGTVIETSPSKSLTEGSPITSMDALKSKTTH